MREVHDLGAPAVVVAHVALEDVYAFLTPADREGFGHAHVHGLLAG